MELDTLLPDYDFRTCYHRRIRADTAAVWDAATNLYAADLPIARGLMLVRTTGKTWLEGPLLEVFPTPTLVTAEGSELVKGRVGKFWRLRAPSAPIPPGDPKAFAAFSEPGWAKSALSLRLVPAGAETDAFFETRVTATDPESRRIFSYYWNFIRFGGAGLIRREMLRAIANKAELST